MANDFTFDESWVAVYRFESGAMLVDSSGYGNTLTDVNTVEENTVDFWEGACSADFERSIGERFTRSDASVSSGFPGKNGTTNTNLAITARFRFEARPALGIRAAICGKWRADGYLSWALLVHNNDEVYKLQFGLGYNSGGSAEYINLCDFEPNTSDWYFMGLSYNDSTQTYIYTLYQRGTPDIKLSEGSGSTINQMSVDSGLFSIGSTYANASSGANYWDGELDEIAIANSPKTLADFDAIRTFSYGDGGETPTFNPSWARNCNNLLSGSFANV